MEEKANSKRARWVARGVMILGVIITFILLNKSRADVINMRCAGLSFWAGIGFDLFGLLPFTIAVFGLGYVWKLTDGREGE